MIYEIKRGSTVIAAVRASGKQFKAIMSEDRVEMEFSLPSPVAFQIGDTVEVYGQTYKINRPSNIGRRFDKIGFTYQLEFEALYYDLGKWELKTLDKDNQLTESEVYMMSDAATMIDLIVRNANRVSSGWTVGAVEPTEVMQFGYSNAKLLTVLQDLADKYNLEFWVTGKQINFGRNQASSGLTWEYGKANELYELRRDRSDIPVINRLTVLGGTRNLPADYGHRRLQPTGGNPITVTPVGDVVEQTVTFDNIYPHRVGTVSHVTADNVFRDTSLDFNINSYLTNEPAKVAFISGQLAGFTFTIADAGYDHATRQITLNPIIDDPAYPSGVPNAVLKPAVGDKYVLLDIFMPPSYVAAEEAKLQDIGEQYLEDYKVSHYNWSASLKPKYVLEDAVELVLGNTVRIVDTPLGVDTDIRISGFTRDLQEPYRYEVSLSNIITVSELVSQRNAQDRLAYTIQRSGLADGSLQTSETLQSVTRRGSVTDRAITVRGTRNTHLLSVPLAAPLTEDVVPGEAYIWFGAPGSGGGGGTSGTLAGLDDTLITSPQNDQVLTYDASIGRWKNSSFTVDLTGYATQSWVNAQGYAVLGTAGGQVRNNTQLDARYKAIGWMPTWAEVSDKPTTFAPSAHTHNASDINAGTLAIARIPTGTTAGTVAVGNDSRIINGQTAHGWGNHQLAGYAVRASDNTFTAHNHFTGALSIPQAAPSGPHAGQAYLWFGAPGSGGGGGSAGTLAGLDDVALSSVTNNQFLRYNSSTGKWVNSTFTVDLSGYAVLGTGSAQVRNNSQLDARYAPISHTHPISQVTGLQAALDGKEPAFAKNSAFNKNFGTTSGTVAQGNDSRIVNGQTAFGWGNHTEAGYWNIFNAPAYQALSDLNDAVRGSFELNTVASNRPTSQASVLTVNQYSTGNNDLLQVNWPFRGNGVFAIRNKGNTGAWGNWNIFWHDGNLNPSDFGTLAGSNTWTAHNHFTGALSIPQSAPTGPHSGQAYVWFGAPGSGGGGGTSGTLAGLDDIALASLANNQLLRYNSSTGKWVNFTASYAPASHTHPISQITGLQAALDGKEPAFAKNSGFNRPFGTTANTVAQGNDSRIVNGQTAYSWGNHSSEGYFSNNYFVGQNSGAVENLDESLPLGGYRSGYGTNTWAGDGPSGKSYGGFIKFSRGGNNSGVQFYYNNGHGGADGRYWFRSKNNGGLTPWYELWHSGNLANGTTSQYIRGNGSLATFPTIGSGTLSLSTGTGLSGSASFGANQTGNTTFSVSVASGYTLPTNGQVSNWNAAYGWGDYRQWGLASINSLGSIAAFDGLGAANQFICASTAANTPFTQLGAGIHMALASTRMAQLWFNTSAQTVQFRTNHSGWNSVHTFWTTQNLDKSEFVWSSGNQTGLSGNKTWTGVHTFSSSVTIAASAANTGGISFASTSVLRETATGNVILASPLGSLYLRPSGTGSATGQAVISPDGATSFSGKITCPVIEPSAIIVPSAAPSSPESGKRYIWVS
ncbi:phage tail protein [Parapedobacter soli]|uniref:phage tail protein n=1 Tax=Parapedobacter soli TaxID=416955 RepID=UPI0021C919E6|nr:phage tail protein [Parapedobacter soli]